MRMSTRRMMPGGGIGDGDPKPVDRDIDMERLRDLEAVYNAPKKFRPGQLIQRVDNSNMSPNNLYVVLEVIEGVEVLYNVADPATYGQSFEIRVAWYDIDGDLCVTPADSRYFEEARDVA